MGIVGELFAFCYQQAPLRQVNQAGIPAKGQKPRDFCLAGIKATSVSLPPDSFFSKILKIHGLRSLFPVYAICCENGGFRPPADLGSPGAVKKMKAGSVTRSRAMC